MRRARATWNSLSLRRTGAANARAGCVPCAVFAVAFGLLVESTAGGHPISVSRGVVTVEASRVVATIRVSGEELVHGAPAYHDRGGLDAARLRGIFDEKAAELIQSIVLRGADGARLAGRLTGARLTDADGASLDPQGLRRVRAEYWIEYRLSAPPRILTFRQEPAAGPAGLPTQYALLVRQSPAQRERTIRLSAGGNAETLEFEWPGGPEAAEPVGQDSLEQHLAQHRFEAVQAVIRLEGHRIELEVHVPLPLMETWVPVPRHDADFVEIAEQTAAAPRLERVLNQCASVSLNGQARTADSIRLCFLGPCDTGVDTACAPARLGAWTARVGAVIEFGAAEGLQAADITWRLFNGGVLTAESLVIDGPTRRLHPFSTYEPTLHVVRP